MGYTNIVTPMTSFIEILVPKDEHIKIPRLLLGGIYISVFDSYLYIGNRIINDSNNPDNSKVKLCFIGLYNPFETTNVVTIDKKTVAKGFYRRVLLC